MESDASNELSGRQILKLLLSPIVIVSALGYFVDVFDLILFSVVRVSSLKDLGLSPAAVTSDGVFLINCQMVGMLAGGVFWGILGDKVGRVKVLFGSIILYSLANICNAFVGSVESYAFWRFVAGVGLAGEIGAGITLVAEVLPQRIRGYGTTIVASVGVLGAVAAGFAGEHFPWRYSYFIGGVLGLILLCLRVSVHESGMFSKMTHHSVPRGDIRLLFCSKERLARYLKCMIVGLPTWFIVGILMTFSPEISSALGAPELPRPGLTVIWCYLGLFVGDASSGVLSQYMQSRRKAISFFVLVGALTGTLFLTLSAPSLPVLYGFYFVLGFSAGFWVLTLTTAAEQFGTNLRSTVATTVPNFIRGALVPMTFLFRELNPVTGIVVSCAVVGLIAFGSSILAVWSLDETYSKDLDYLEHPEAT